MKALGLIAGYALIWSLTNFQQAGWWWLLVGVGCGLGLILADWRWGAQLSQVWFEQAQPVRFTESLLLLGVLMVASVFVITSSASLVGVGTCVTLLMYGVGQLWQEYHQPERFQARFLWQLRTKSWSLSVQQRLIQVMTGLVVFLVALTWL